MWGRNTVQPIEAKREIAICVTRAQNDALSL